MTPVAQNKTVLVLKSNNRNWRPALLVDSNGRQEELSCFVHDDNTDASSSCSLIWNNHLYIYGGNNFNRQISKLNQYRLQRVGDLQFDFNEGACTNMAGRKLFLCFDFDDSKRCYWSENPLADFQNITLASYAHYRTRISSSECKLLNFCEGKKVNCEAAFIFLLIKFQSRHSYKQRDLPFEWNLTKIVAAFLAVGSMFPENVKTEMYIEESNTWTTLQDYPYAGMRLFQAPIIFRLYLS